MIDIHSREDELGVQIIGLQGKIERLEREIKENKEEFLADLKEIPTFEHIVQNYLLDLKKKWEKK